LPRPRPPFPRFLGFPARLPVWLNANGALLAALALLRQIDGDAAAAATRAVLNVPVVRQRRLSWRLWASLMQTEGIDPRARLLRLKTAGSAVNTALQQQL
jgi:hypothetical protein